MSIIRLEEGEGRTKLHLIAVFSGDDLIVVIFGGNRPHIGSVTVAYPPFTDEEKKREKEGVVLSTIPLPGHKDYVVSEMVAEKVSRVLGRVVAVSVGIHIERASKAEIEEVLKNSEKLANAFLNTA
ncbi:MAG: hypothetical protein ACETVN_02875, partial [Asgard group archaeon]